MGVDMFLNRTFKPVFVFVFVSVLALSMALLAFPQAAAAQPLMESFKLAIDTTGGNVVAGDVITYYITLTNLGDATQVDDPAVNEFEDPIPANSTYNAFIPATATSGTISYDLINNRIIWNGSIDPGVANTVILTFSVILDFVLPDGTVVSNQGTVNWDSNGDGIADSVELTDDPRTPLTQGDATDVVIGQALSITYAGKTVIDLNGGTLLPGETLRYDIALTNFSIMDLKSQLLDTIPRHTAYVAGSVQAMDVNGNPIGTATYNAVNERIEWDGDVPFMGLVDISFEVTVDAGTPPGTLISNQGTHNYDSNDDGTLDASQLTDNPLTPDVQGDATIITVSAPAIETWYLAEGATDGGFETWVLVQNPNPDPVHIDILFQTDMGEIVDPSLVYIEIPALSRRSFNVGDYVTTFDVSTQVNATDGSIIVERAMYWGDRIDGHDSIGVTAPAPTWYLAEGATDGGFETWVLVQNPGGAAVHVDFTLNTDTGELLPPDLQGVEIPGFSRRSFNLGNYVTTFDVSTKVTSTDGEVICERAMYWGDREGGHDSIGVTAPAPTWYLAEGATDGGFETWLLVQNPGTDTVNVDIAFQTELGEVAPDMLQGVPIPAGSRSTFNVGSFVTTYNVSTKVTATNGEVICERAMYWGDRIGGHDSIGYAPPP
jgi:uncharacterized repeat protein (TIGR01451 family)